MSNKPVKTEEEPVRITTRRKVRTVEIEVDDSGEYKKFILKEMFGPGLTTWTNLNSSRLIVEEGKPVGMEPIDDMHAVLVSLCLHDAEGTPVPQTTISQWSASAQRTLFTMCQELNGLTDEAREQEKKSSKPEGTKRRGV